MTQPLASRLLCPICEGKGSIFDAIGGVIVTCTKCSGKGTIPNSAHNRMTRLRDLCAKLPREHVLTATDEMNESDAALVRRILDDVQPPSDPVTVQ